MNDRARYAILLDAALEAARSYYETLRELRLCAEDEQATISEQRVNRDIALLIAARSRLQMSGQR